MCAPMTDMVERVKAAMEQAERHWERCPHGSRREAASPWNRHRQCWLRAAQCLRRYCTSRPGHLIGPLPPMDLNKREKWARECCKAMLDAALGDSAADVGDERREEG